MSDVTKYDACLLFTMFDNIHLRNIHFYTGLILCTIHAVLRTKEHHMHVNQFIFNILSANF